ncbi:Citrate lyase beta subunit [Desulfotomaculum arcticum]|uniref:Citrate lyase beta subunit n=1 Tax=Desulfotruncus arcticus DSM 17038 TaxID=1121424 RepID=A0A1I2PDF1_9FIRM|nr:HpcH/HpaI aldolase/citrate lyase family protein [Desulfotruncus arcticus]SFG14155.1 Citrate lyase beta subunit [Desulfotomaculum arcticum] [Desulfotruncus arcticus DSM 17038]
MIHFDYLSKEQKKKIFYLPPTQGPLNADKQTLAHALGATLYMPGTSNKALNDIINNKIPGLMSAVICLEDAINDREVDVAEKNLLMQLKTLLSLKEKGSSLPFIFIRVRNPQQFKRLVTHLGPALQVLTGFVFPKFNIEVGHEYFEQLIATNQLIGRTLYGMPIFEGPQTIYLESRAKHILNLKQLLDSYKDLVLNIRIGATDLSGLYSLRRSPELTIYDIAVIRDFIADLVNVFGRPQDNYVISGPVWEYFPSGSRMLKPQLRQTPFQEHYGNEGRRVRQSLIGRYIDGLIREVMLDKANGLIGKTIIHPSHILPVQALYAVTHEEYCDAGDILANGDTGGVTKSVYNNKMNEPKPHTNWAKRIMLLSKIYGVLNEHYDYTSIIYEGEKLHGIG